MKDRSNPPGFAGAARELPCRSNPPQYTPISRTPTSVGNQADPAAERAARGRQQAPQQIPLPRIVGGKP
jgi:hypothetical protein